MGTQRRADGVGDKADKPSVLDRFAHDGRPLEHGPCVSIEAIDTRAEQRPDGRRDAVGRSGRGSVDAQGGQLLDEEGHAARRIDDLPALIGIE